MKHARNSQWDQDFRHIARGNRPEWEKLRAASLHDTPGFVSSLHGLLVVEQYQKGDVAAMFGVSRERVRQWSEALGFPKKPKGGRVRVWNDARHRFEPMACLDARRAYAVASNRTREHLNARYEKRRAEIIETLRSYVAQRSPEERQEITYPEMVHLLGYSTGGNASQKLLTLCCGGAPFPAGSLKRFRLLIGLSPVGKTGARYTTPREDCRSLRSGTAAGQDSGKG